MTHPTTDQPGLVLVTGATGYIGDHLIQALVPDRRVRVLTRSQSSAESHDWSSDVEIVTGDAGDEGDLQKALTDVEVAYYLIHSMDDGDFARRDRELATAFATAAEDAGVRRIVYLGGMHPDGKKLSPHLESRVEVGRVFLDSDVPATVLQAAIVLGDGSASFDMLRYLTHRLPLMVTPSWIDNPVQPIAIDDAIRCLVAAGRMPEDVNRTFDIAGPDALTYRELIHTFARVTGLERRRIAAVPMLTPGLASHWVGVVTPIPAPLAKPLVGSLVHPVVAQEHDIDEHLDAPCTIGVEDAIRSAMKTAQPDTGPRNLARYGAAVAACAVVGAVATKPDSGWYRGLAKPAWQPPKAAFPIVWTALYGVLGAVSAQHATALDREDRDTESRAYARATGVNLVLNAGWSALFFRGHRPTAAAAEAALLTLSGADLARRAATTGGRRGVLIGAYAAWCAFATVLTGDIARRNPDSATAVPGRLLRRTRAELHR